jgi:hypothetical protein
MISATTEPWRCGVSHGSWWLVPRSTANGKRQIGQRFQWSASENLADRVKPGKLAERKSQSAAPPHVTSHIVAPAKFIQAP